MNKHDWAVDLVGHFSFSSFGNIITVDVRGTVFFVDTVFGKVFDGVSVIESHKGSLRSNEIWVEGLDNLSSHGVSEKIVHDVANLLVSTMGRTCSGQTHDALEMIKQVLEGNENKLGLEMSVLGQVSTRSALSSAQRA